MVLKTVKMVNFLLCIFYHPHPKITGEPYFADPEFRVVKSSRKSMYREGERTLHEYNTLTLLIKAQR